MLFLFLFFFFHFSKFQMTIAKNLMKKNPFLRCISRFVKFCYVLIAFDIHTFDNETTAFLKFFEISTEMDFVSLFFLDERNISISLSLAAVLILIQAP